MNNELSKKNILLHYEGTKEFILDNIDNMYISTIVYGKINYLLNKINDLSDGYIILPIYEGDKKLEIQLVVSGKCKDNEIPNDGINREVAEELGFSINDDILNLERIPDENNELYFSMLKNCKITSNKLERNFQSVKIDNPKKKVMCWIHMTEIDENIIFNRVRRKSKDDAGYIIGIVPVELIKVILKNWSNKMIRKVSRFCFKVKNYNFNL